MVADATKAKAEFLVKMNKQKTLWLEGSLVKTKHKHFNLFEMVHPAHGVGDELVEHSVSKGKWSLASVYNSRRISTTSPKDSLAELIDRKLFIIDHHINNAEFRTVAQAGFGSLNVETA